MKPLEEVALRALGVTRTGKRESRPGVVYD